jgi:hypothetical protein
MGGLSAFHWTIVAGLFLLAIVVPTIRAGTRRASLVLRSFEVHCTPQPPGQPLVEIVGRPAGIIAFVLTVLQLQPQTKLSVTDSGIDYETASLLGELKKFIPLSRVASMTAGLHKPVGYLIIAGVLFLLGAFFSIQSASSIPLIAALLVSAILLVGYFVSKSILFEIKSNAGIEISLCFRPGVVEGAPVDADKALAAAAIIRDLILERPIGERRESVPVGVDSQFGNRFAQAVPAAQAARHSPPPFADNGAPVIDGDGAHAEQSARDALREAVRLYKAGNRDAAATAMNRVIEEFPNTTAAATAQANLAKVRTELR